MKFFQEKVLSKVVLVAGLAVLGGGMSALNAQSLADCLAAYESEKACFDANRGAGEVQVNCLKDSGRVGINLIADNGAIIFGAVALNKGSSGDKECSIGVSGGSPCGPGHEISPLSGSDFNRWKAFLKSECADAM